MKKITVGIMTPKEVLKRSGYEGLVKSLEILTDKGNTQIIYAENGELFWGYVDTPKTEKVESHGENVAGAADHKDGYDTPTSTHKLVESLAPDPRQGNSGQQPQPEICCVCKRINHSGKQPCQSCIDYILRR